MPSTLRGVGAAVGLMLVTLATGSGASEPEEIRMLKLIGSAEPFAAGGEFTFQRTHNRWVGGFMGAQLLLSESLDDALWGMYGGLTLQTPLEVTPYAQLGVGFLSSDFWPDDDDDDDFYRDEEEVDEQFLLEVFGECGLRARISTSLHLFVGSRYHVTTAGRHRDFWTYTAGIGKTF